jgi:hypothetical protein
MAAPLRPGQLTVIAMAAAVAILLVVIAAETGWGEGLHARLPVRILPAAAPVEAKLLPQLVASAPEQAWPETAARPLFVPGRRPAPPVVATTAMRKGQFILQGTTIVGPMSIAMLKEVSTGKMYRVERGRELLGMTLAEIAADRVTLRSGDDSETLVLVVARAGAATQGAQAAQAPFVQAGPFSSPAQAPGTSAMPVPPANVPLPGSRAATGVPQPATVNVPGSGAQPAANSGSGATGTGPQGVPAGPPITATTDSSPTTPEEIIARRRAARQIQRTN